MTDLTAKSNVELAEAAGCHPDLWSTLGPSLESLIALAEQRAIQRLEGKQASTLQGDVAGLQKDTEIENWKKAIRAISVLNKSLVAERDTLQATADRMKAKLVRILSFWRQSTEKATALQAQVESAFREKFNAFQAQCDALQAKLDKLQEQKPVGYVEAYAYHSNGATATVVIENNLLNAGTEKMYQGLLLYPAPAGTSQILEALRTAHDHLDMDALEVSHCKDAAAIRAALGASTLADEASLTAEIERLDNANKSLHEYTVRVSNECDRLQARIAELESQQVPEWFQEQVLAVQAERNALKAEVLEVTGYWKAATAKNRQLLAELLDTQASLEELRSQRAA